MVFPLETTINHSCKMSCYIHGYDFYLFYLNQNLNVFLMGSIKFFVLVLVHLIHHPLLVLLRLYACLPFLSFQLKPSLAELYLIPLQIYSSCCLNLLASIYSPSLPPSGHLFASLPSQSEPCLVGVSPLNSICFNSVFFM